MRARSQVSHEQEMHGGTGASWSVEVRDLITPEEASRLFGREDEQRRQLVVLSGQKPLILSRLNYDEHPYFKERKLGKYRNQFDSWGY